MMGSGLCSNWNRLVGLDQSVESVSTFFRMPRCQHFATPTVVSATILDETVKCDILCTGLGWHLNGLIADRNIDWRDL